jgi:AhpD family alkylhydroperoxidase
LGFFPETKKTRLKSVLQTPGLSQCSTLWYIARAHYNIAQVICERTIPMDEFDLYRSEMNEKLLDSGHLGIKRFFALDTQAYEDGALDKRTKELMGLVGSVVLRCDDCITYHVKQCAANGVTREQFMDAFNVALVVGGSITIPHLRRAVEKLDQIL